MAIITKGVFTDIDNMLMQPLTKTMDKTIASRYCVLAAQLKKFHSFCNRFMATICLCPRFIITGCETTDNTSII
ncbi:hypothetical protein CER18_04205 [Bartonella tribocorum]|uniref:Uncharacterized protein n=1 Tax=Bartonella tribocorum TaxID=85701 RepID=A0A2M6UST7_9HYPH|nr:hypothetical protein CER18_04205 [Bartonella tribocorum]